VRVSVIGPVISGSLLLPAGSNAASAQGLAPFDCSVTARRSGSRLYLQRSRRGGSPVARELISRPMHGRDGLELAPTFVAFARGPVAASNSFRYTRTRNFVRSARHGRRHLPGCAKYGRHGTNLQTGRGAWTRPAVSLGVAWRARGSGPAMKGHQYVSADSKILVLALREKSGERCSAPTHSDRRLS
jgi:hypothetical protein